MTQNSNVEDIYRLTPLQEGMLFACLQAPESGLYVEQALYRLPRLEAAACEAAWREVIARFGILRTGFVYEGVDRPLQVIHRKARCPVEEIDLAGLPEADRRRRLEAFVAADGQRGFDLGKPPLMRLALIHTGPAETLLLWTFHHILLDGWSALRLFAEALAAGAALERGQAYRPPPAPSFKDYVRWLHGRDRAAAEHYWRRYLAGFTAPTRLGLPELPARDSRRAAPAVLRRTLAPELAAALGAFARAHRLTAGTLYAGAWAVLLSLYSGESDVVFGLATTGRPAEIPDADRIVGLLVNTLPLRVRLDGARAAGDWLRDLQRGQWELREHEYCPLVDIQGWSEVPRGTSLFHSILNVESVPDFGVADMPDVQVNEHLDYPLSLVVVPGERIVVRAQFDPDRYAGATLDRLLARYERVLGELVRHPERKLAALSLLDASERARLAVLDAHRRVFPETDSLERAIARRAEATPDADAVVAGAARLSYRELQRRSGLLAARLAARGFRAGDIVPILFAPGLDVVVAMLALVRLGCAYAPLSPDTPAPRLAAMLENLGASRFLSHRGLGAELAGRGFEALDLEALEAEKEAPAEPPYLPPEAGDRLLYVIHTSGSTGKPKAAGVTHRGYLNLVRSWLAEFGFGPGDRGLLTNRLSHDLAQKSVWVALAGGGAVRVMEGPFDPEAILETTAAAGITWLSMTPSMAYVVVDAAAPDWNRLSGLRYLFVGGEPLNKERLRDWAASPAFRTEFVTTYGPTETTDVTHWHRFTREQLLDPDFPVPVGKSLPNLVTYVLDGHGNRLPAGLRGELALGGLPVGTGYLNNPWETALKFLPDPDAEQPGARLYLTGDLGWQDEDGTVYVGGRVDFQVKIRGFRIEPGEIDAVLHAHPAVADAVTVPHRAGADELVAYVAVAAGTDPAGLRGALAEHCRARLPDYMVPGAFVLLDALPLSANGKVERSALPPPGRDDRPAAAATVAPRDDEEARLHALWSALLPNAGSFGVEDSFFALGGHSLLLTQLFTRIPKMFGVQLPLSALFTHPTIAEQARAIRDLLAVRDAAPPVIAPAPREGRTPLSFAQERLWFLHRYAPDNPAYNVPLALPLPAPADAAAARAALRDLGRRHESLRTRFPAVDGVPFQDVLAEPEIEWEELDLGAAAEPETRLREALAGQLARPFDLAARPPWRALLGVLPDGSALLHLTLYHILTDGWSAGLLRREFAACYEARRGGRAPELPAPPIQYADYALWQRRTLSGERLNQSLEYWRGQLSGSHAGLALPCDFPRPAQLDYEGGWVRRVLPRELAERAEAGAGRLGGSLFMLLGAALAGLLYRLSGQADFNLGTPIANRHLAETQEVVGCFVNTLVLRFRVEPGLSFKGLLEQVRTRMLGAQDHQDLPFELLVDRLQLPRQAGLLPLFQVMYTLNTAGEPDPEPLDPERWVARFDLQVVFTRTEAGLAAVFEYRRSLFRAATVEHFARLFERFLEAALDDPERPLAVLPLADAAMAAAELGLAPASGNPPADEAIETLFQRQAESHPERTALILRGERLSYRELNERANRLAHHLLALGLVPNEGVGVSLPRGFDLAVALLAILKAGGAYVPLDPAYPAERLRFMAEDADLRLLVADAASAARFRASPLVVVDPHPPEIAARSAWNPRPPALANGERIAYLVYTSGTTGRPKGVPALHRGVIRLVKGRLPYPLDAETVMLQAAPAAFDASTWELWGPLLNGGTVAVYAEPHMDLDALDALLESARVNTAFMTTALFHQWSGRLTGPTPVRWLLAGGEVVSPAAMARLYAADPEVRGFNVYGPTENTTYSTYGPVPRGFDPGLPLPIGRSVDHSSAYVLDDLLRVVPVGVVGELYVGGEGLALGYHRRPGLTAAKFLPNPYGPPGSRLYATGDRVRRRADGQIEFLGRLDEQVKIRGFRIEPAEIEALLLRHPGIREGAVLAVEQPGTGKQLAAYFSTGGTDTPPTAEQLRRHLRGLLPEYMVPALWLELPALPMNANGKLDRSRLPDPMAAPNDYAPVPPDGVWEERILGLWRTLLEREDFGVTDDFFGLGGHSLLAARMATAIRGEWEVPLPLEQIFAEPTVRALARYCEITRWHGDHAGRQAPLDEHEEVGIL